MDTPSPGIQEDSVPWLLCRHIPSCSPTRQISPCNSVFLFIAVWFETPCVPRTQQQPNVSWAEEQSDCTAPPGVSGRLALLPSLLSRGLVSCLPVLCLGHLHLLFSHLPLAGSHLSLAPSHPFVLFSLLISHICTAARWRICQFPHQLFECTPAQQVFTHISRSPLICFLGSC